MAEQLYKTVTIDIIAAAVRFPYYSEISLVNGMPLHFLYCSEIWHLHEIFLVKNTWHAVTFPMHSEIWHLQEISLAMAHGMLSHFLIATTVGLWKGVL